MMMMMMIITSTIVDCSIENIIDSLFLIEFVRPNTSIALVSRMIVMIIEMIEWMIIIFTIAYTFTIIGPESFRLIVVEPNTFFGAKFIRSSSMIESFHVAWTWLIDSFVW